MIRELVEQQEQLVTDGGTESVGTEKPGDVSDLVALVGCGSQKRSRETEAWKLYTSAYFETKRHFAEDLCDRWFVVSAKYGLVYPDEKIAPYDLTVQDLDAHKRDEWAAEVATDLLDELDDHTEVVFLAGRDYVEPVTEALVEDMADERIHDPFLETSGIGEQISWLRTATVAGDPFVPVDEEVDEPLGDDTAVDRPGSEKTLADFGGGSA